MWDDDDSPVAVAPAAPSGIGNTLGNGFFVGRGRGFGNTSQMSSSVPQVGSQSNGGQDGWDDGDSTSFKAKSQSGWEDQWEDNESSSANNNTWNSNSNNRDTSSRFNDSRPSKSSKCFKCDEEGHISRDCPSGDNRRGGGGGGRSCFTCGDSGHLSKDCPNKGSSNRSGGGNSRGCFKCGEMGHMSRDCTNESQGGGGGNRNGGGSKGCYNCGEEGHMSRDCTNESRGGGNRGGNSRGCYKCGEDGHMSRDCTNESRGGDRGGGSRGGGGNSRGCYKCGEDGHMSRDCTNESRGGDRSGGSRGGGGCYNCGEDGHMSKDCTNERSSKSSKGCFKCHQDGHMAKDCTNEAVGEDGKPRPPPYIPPEPSEDAEVLFMGVPTGINFSKYDNIHVHVSGPDGPPPIDSFESSGLCDLLLRNIKNSKYVKPTPVQKYSIPIIKNKRDLMACAQTGSGKTAAFLLPILNTMIPNPDLPNNANQEVQEPWAVIVAPTRELVMQIGSEARKFAYDSVVKADVVYGGTSTSYQSSRLKRGCHILVATPGRLLDFLGKGKISFSQLRYLVLDEADRMLDMGFAPAIKEMVSHESMPPKGVRQTLMFSATFPDTIQEMAKEYLENYLFLTVGMIGAANTDVEQTFFNVGQFDKRQKLLDILKEAGSDRTLVFVEQKRTADFIASLCSQNNIPTTSIHGDRLQREREEALKDFRTGKMPVLVATAVAARGLDIRDVRHVINYDLPKSIDEYVHRIGRTGRVGNLGKATSFYDSSSDQELARSLKKILIDAQQSVPDWLSEEANSAVGTTVQYGGRGNFGGRDVRSHGRGRNPDSSNAFDNNFDTNDNYSSPSTFQEPVADDENWC